MVLYSSMWQDVEADFIDDLTIMPSQEYLDYVMPEDREPVWIKEATCRGLDPDLFFPERGESTREAKSICAICPVRRECLELAVQKVEKFGIWGMMSERERRKVRRDRKNRLAAESKVESDNV